MSFDYTGSRWAALRESALRRDHYRCRECSRYGRRTDATHVHHVWPVEDFPEYRWSRWNLLSLCLGCHNAMHDRETRQLTALGESWRRRTIPPTPPGEG